MIARHEDGAVVLRPTLYDPEVYTKALAEYEEAWQVYRAHERDLATSELAPFRDRAEAATQDWEELLSDVNDIDQAERLYRQLGKAILEARVARGDFDYRRGDE